MLHLLDLCIACTGLVCFMYWTDVLFVLDWCDVCTGLMYTEHVLDWIVVCTGLVYCMHWAGVLPRGIRIIISGGL